MGPSFNFCCSFCYFCYFCFDFCGAIFT